MRGQVLEDGTEVRNRVPRGWVDKLPAAIKAAKKAAKKAAERGDGGRDEDETSMEAEEGGDGGQDEEEPSKKVEEKGDGRRDEEEPSDEEDCAEDAEALLEEKRELEEAVKELCEDIADKTEEMVSEASLAELSSRRAMQLAKKNPVDPMKLGDAYAKAINHLSATRLAIVTRTLTAIRKGKTQARICELNKSLVRTTQRKQKGKRPAKKTVTARGESTKAGPSGTRHSPVAAEDAPENGASNGSPA